LGRSVVFLCTPPVSAVRINVGGIDASLCGGQSLTLTRSPAASAGRLQPMPLKQSEAIVLRTYPLRESDLLVTLFTRAEGRVKGVARAAKKSKRRFGGALEPLTLIRVYYDDREGQELARLDSCDILDSPLSHSLDYARVAALEHVGELLDELLPEREANDAIFRLTYSV